MVKFLFDRKDDLKSFLFFPLPYFLDRSLFAYKISFIKIDLNNWEFLSKKTMISGNLKFDEEYPRLYSQELDQWRSQLGISSNDRVIVVGSTHDPEENLF